MRVFYVLILHMLGRYVYYKGHGKTVAAHNSEFVDMKGGKKYESLIV